MKGPLYPSFSPNVRLDFTAAQSDNIFLRLTTHDATVAGNAVAYQLTPRHF